ncbi:hypothetical protein TVAG_083230 [Trichomonas vaginalis G3]|uniref:RING-type domain-containing protein n=1 Tax=Trichomonas vaginalis (strain ATCC PRA-98 / G3) TaxID=412133 RepID=A2DM50_TRIV3|nr:VPS8 subunit of corvet complex family [Trichomonas vaginalis G3]EAY18470.1 hypothetical protein TVAG_083230 [Trichomonas vaginalis G3]KAI5489541.1 VPS8 subunit of corvet complex family [Trichomonas vaginalis G3]|eukprot:XP_001579456.1 hypothetical protein [Trichomonas vaginalis G3]
MQSLDYYKIQPLPAIKDHIKAVGINDLKCCARSGTMLAFISDIPVPFIYNTNTEICRDFKLENVPSSPLSAIDISRDCKYVITGHENGSISIWSIMDFKIVKNFSTGFNKKIVCLHYGWTPNEIFLGDESGRVSKIQIRQLMGYFAISETFLIQGDEELTNIITMKQGYPFNAVFISWKTSYMIYNGDTLAVTAKSSKYEDEISIDHYFDEEKIVLTVSTQSQFTLLCFTGPKKFTQICSHKLNSGTIVISEFLASGLFVCITDGGELTIVSFDGKIAQQIPANDLYQSSVSSSYIQPYDDKMILVQRFGCLLVDFLDWRGKIKTLVNSLNFAEAFRLLIEIDAGLAKDLVGLPKNPTECRRQLRDITSFVVLQFLKHYLLNGTDEEIDDAVASAVANVASLKMTSILEQAADLFTAVGKGMDFYIGTLRSTVKQVSSLLTPAFIEQFLKLAQSSEMIDFAEEELLTPKLDPAYTVEIFKVALKYNLIKFQKRLFTEYFDDFVSPCELYHKNNRLIDYCREVFLDENQNLYNKAAKRSVSLWLLYPGNDGSFGRLQTLFNSSLEDSPKYISSILSVCPIPVSEEKELGYAPVIDTFLRVLEKYNFEIAKPMLSSIIPYYERDKTLIPTTAALKHVIKYISVSSENENSTEFLLSKILDRFPTLIPLNSLQELCQSRGFVNIALDKFMQSKNYSVIVGSFVNSSDKKVTVFDFINAHLEDHDELRTSIIENISGLLVVDAQQTCRVIYKYFKEDLEYFIKTLERQTLFVFLRGLDDVVGDIAFDKDLNIKYLDMLCEYSPQEAVHFLKNRLEIDAEKEFSIDLEKSLKIAKKWGRIDCEIRLQIHNSSYNEAVELIGSEIESSLLDLLEIPVFDGCKSIDELSDSSVVNRQMQAVTIAVSLLSELSKEENNIQRWQKVFKSFQFPLYLASKMKESDKKAVTLTLIFSYFCLQSLSIIGSEITFKILSLFFSALPRHIYHSALSYIFQSLNYQTKLNEVVEEILIDDCLKLIEKSDNKRMGGLFSGEPVCAICHEPLLKAYSPFKVFPCGHCLHENTKCGYHEYCTVCSGSGNNNLQEDVVSTDVNSGRNINRMMRMFNMKIKPQYSDYVECEYSSSSLMFAHVQELDGERATYAKPDVTSIGTLFQLNIPK